MKQCLQCLRIAIHSRSLRTTNPPVSNRAATELSDESSKQNKSNHAIHRDAFRKIEIAAQTSAGSKVAIAKGAETITAPVKLQ